MSKPSLFDSDLPVDDEFRKGYAFETGDGVVQNLRQAEIHYLNSRSPVSNYRLGCILESGGLGKPDAKGAFRRMRKAAEAGYGPARMRLAEYYADGFGIDTDPVSAIDIYLDLYRGSADDGSGQRVLDDMKRILERFDRESPIREYLTGLVCEGTLTDPMFHEALSHYEDAGARGIPEAWYRAGVLHETKPVPDMGSAIRCYKSSFEGGNVQSSMRLGILCFEGKGLGQNVPLAFRFFRRAADGGEPYGLLWSAIMLQYGIGTEKDARTAKQYYESAVEADIPDAPFWEGLLMRYGADDIPRNVLEAHRLFKKASDYGNGRAMYELGRMYEDGVGVKADVATARMYYGRAARNGCQVVNGRADPLDSMLCLEGMIHSHSSLHLPTRSPAVTVTDMNDEPEAVIDKIQEAGVTYPEVQESNDTPAQVLKRLNDQMGRGGQTAKDAREEAMFLFNSCFGLDSDFDRMYGLYISILNEHSVGELQFRIAQMMIDEDSPIHDENRALQWFEKALENGENDSAIFIGDHYLDGKDDPNPTEAASWYLRAISKRSEFQKLESRFSRIMEILKDSGDAEQVANMARKLSQSKLVGHDTVLMFFTDALELGRVEVATELRDYLKSYGLEYEREDLLESSLRVMESRAKNNVACPMDMSDSRSDVSHSPELTQYDVIIKPKSSGRPNPENVTKPLLQESSVKSERKVESVQFSGPMVTKLIPSLTDGMNPDCII